MKRRPPLIERSLRIYYSLVYLLLKSSRSLRQEGSSNPAEQTLSGEPLGLSR